MAGSTKRRDVGPLSVEGELSSTGSVAITRVLRQHEMPTDEIRAILETDEPELVHRYIELHRERLEERLAEQLRTLANVERLLTS